MLLSFMLSEVGFTRAASFWRRGLLKPLLVGIVPPVLQWLTPFFVGDVCSVYLAPDEVADAVESRALVVSWGTDCGLLQLTPLLRKRQ